MGWTKRQIVMAAFEEIGLGAEVYDVQPGQLASALKRLDAMVAEWNGRGIRIGYPLPASPAESSLDDATNVPDSAVETLFLSLAVRIAPGYGKQVMPDTKATAKESYNTLLSLAAMPKEQQMPGTMPAGAGNKPWRLDDKPFLRSPVDQVLAGGDGPIDYN